jgi:2,3-bisphosphoglycerate-independent phosphoglycerate mutase
MTMKYAIVLPDGAADEPVETLGGRTPLEAAATPNMDWIAAHGRIGTVVSVPDGFHPGSDVATLTLFGCDVRHEYFGRAPLEAAAREIRVGDDQIVFRCNFVTVTDGRMADFTAGHITQREADQLIGDLNTALGDTGCRFYSGVSYRNLLVANAPPDADPKCVPPHDIPDQPIHKHLPRGRGAEWVKDKMQRARDVLAEHDVNAVRADLGENPATDIWLWGQGRPQSLKSFRDRYGVSAAVIAAVDLIRGIARSLEMKLIHVPGATGYLDTNYAGKGEAAVRALDEYDLVAVHIEAPDEAGHLGNVEAKVKAIESVDQHIVGPVLRKLRTFTRWRMLVAPDHPTPVLKRVHTGAPPPFCLSGHRIESMSVRGFSESIAAESAFVIDPGHELMEYFLRP